PVVRANAAVTAAIVMDLRMVDPCSAGQGVSLSYAAGLLHVRAAMARSAAVEEVHDNWLRARIDVRYHQVMNPCRGGTMAHDDHDKHDHHHHGHHGHDHHHGHDDHGHGHTHAHDHGHAHDHHHGGGHHDWHSKSYVADWIASDEKRHAERKPFLDALIAAVPFARDAEIAVLDVGGGAGVVSAALLDAFPRATVTLQDFSVPMIEMARKALAADAARTRYVLCDLRDPAWEQAVGRPVDLVVSAIAIHHLGHLA